jgi:hypothetical protein
MFSGSQTIWQRLAGNRSQKSVRPIALNREYLWLSEYVPFSGDGAQGSNRSLYDVNTSAVTLISSSGTHNI